MEGPIQPTDVFTVTCPNCGTAAVQGKIFCNKCAYPVNGTPEQKENYEQTKHTLNTDYGIAMQSVRNARIALYVIAGFLGVFGFIFAILVALGVTKTQAGDYSTPIRMAIPIAIGAVAFIGIFGGLGYWSKTNPFTALLTSSILFFLLNIGNLANFDRQPETYVSSAIYLVIFILQILGCAAGYNLNKQKQQFK